MMAVIDASVAVKFVAEEPGSDAASRLLTGEELLIAPDWVLIEVSHALWKKARSGILARDAAVEAVNALPTFFQTLHETRPLLERAYELAFELRHWLYDCLYLQLALDQETTLVTADKAFRNAAVRGGLGSHVLLLEDASA